MKELRFRLEDQLHREVKERAAALGLSMADYAIAALRQMLMKAAPSLDTPFHAHNAEISTPESSTAKEEKRNEEERTKEEVKKKEENDENNGKNARARKSSNSNEPPSDDEVRNFARTVRPIPEEIVEAWLDRAKECGWYAKDRHGNIIPINRNSWRILLTGFARNYTKWQKNAQRDETRDVKKRAAARPVVHGGGERKKPSWLTWEQWQFEEAERMANERRIEKVERVSARLAKVRKEFGLC